LRTRLWGHVRWTLGLWLRPNDWRTHFRWTYVWWSRARREVVRWTRIGANVGLRRTRVWAIARWWSVARTPVIPLRLGSIPRAITVVIVPIAADDEAQNWQREVLSVAINRPRLTLVRVVYILGVHPAAIIAGRDIAPAVIFKAAVDVNERTRRHPRHKRIAAVRASAYVHGLVGDGLLRSSRGTKDQYRTRDSERGVKTRDVHR